MSFESMKRNRAKSVEKLLETADQQNNSGGNYDKDERLWQPTVDKAGNGFSVIRFLPESEATPTPWVRYWSHGFKGPTGKWYIENSLTSIGQDDPVAEANNKLWESGDAGKKIVSGTPGNPGRKRKLHYVSNILVVSDPSNPDNEGKVFMYKYGKKIFDKLMEAMEPQFEDETPFSPFDFWEGADFKLKIRKVEGYRNYDKSEFATPTALSDDDAKLEGIYGQLHDLGEFTAPTNYKSYAELKAHMAKVLGESVPQTPQQTSDLDESTPPKSPSKSVPPVMSEPEVPAPALDVSDDDAEDAMSYFANLAKED